MAAKLAVYNDALSQLGERKLASLSEARPPRYYLDDHWDEGLRYCLEQGLWNFALRTVQLDSSASIGPEFGFTYAFEKPDDWIRTAQMSAGERLDPPLLQVSEEGGYWYADIDPLYVQYVSDSVSYGLDLSRWPSTFTTYVATYLARKIASNLTGSEEKIDRLVKMEKRARMDARAKDALNQPIGFAPTGTWARSRGSGIQRSRWDRSS